MRPKAHPVGTLVRSHYRSPWYGVVVASGRDHDYTAAHVVWVDINNNASPLSLGERNDRYRFCIPKWCVVVKVTHSADARPLRKPIYRSLSSTLLEVIKEIPQ